MGNRFHYRCPKCGSRDDIEVCAFVTIRLTQEGTEGDASNLGPDDWTSVSGADCRTCGYEGMAGDFEPEGQTLVLNADFRRRKPK